MKETTYFYEKIDTSVCYRPLRLKMNNQNQNKLPKF